MDIQEARRFARDTYRLHPEGINDYIVGWLRSEIQTGSSNNWLGAMLRAMLDAIDEERGSDEPGRPVELLDFDDSVNVVVADGRRLWICTERRGTILRAKARAISVEVR